jgi:uncharacterized membrane protein YgcG
VLLAVDPPKGRAGLMVGYGLEPFLGEEAHDHLVENAEPMWRARRFADGILGVLRGLDRLLTGVIDTLPETFGLSEAPPEPDRAGDF